MLELFPGNYRWSYNTHLAFAAGGQLGDLALIMPVLTENVGNDEVWHDEWTRLAGIVEERAQSEERAQREERAPCPRPREARRLRKRMPEARDGSRGRWYRR